MKYDMKKFEENVNYYKKKFGNIKGKTIFIEIEGLNKDAFYSTAALSRAAHDIGADVHVSLSTDKNNEGKQVIKDLWNLYVDYSSKKKTSNLKALTEFTDNVAKKTGKKDFIDIFRGPELFLTAQIDGFFDNSAKVSVEYKFDWFKPFRFDEVVATSKRILIQGYALKKNERMSISFTLVPSAKEIELPLEDYLDSFSIAFSMGLAAEKMGAIVSLGSSSDRKSQLDNPVRTTDLMTTIRGCELSKDIDEPLFKKYNVLSKLMRIDRIKNAQAGFGIHGKGYYGTHFFGENIGYPSPNKKTRWSSPGQIMTKDHYSPQAKYETRDPTMRYAITETIPLDLYIETCNIDYTEIKKRSTKIRDIMNKCKYVRATGKEIDGFRTELNFKLFTKKGEKREFTSSDCDVTSIIDKEYEQKTGMRTGSFANFPSGEAFVTPEELDGTLLGDVVINVNRSMVIPKNKPLKLKFNMGKWELIDGPDNIKQAMKKEKGDAWKRVLLFKKKKSLPKEVIDTYEKNFDGIGEFAINTNPKARLCDYLIVNEKIAKMIHLALGSGFEADRRTLYHWDIVCDAPRQEMDIYGVDAKGKEYWVMKKGKFVA